MKRVILVMLLLALSGCVRKEYIPDYPVGTLVRNKLTGLNGIVQDWWCYQKPCQYWVKYALTHVTGNSRFFLTGNYGGGRSEVGTELWKEDYSMEYELEPLEQPRPVIYSGDRNDLEDFGDTEDLGDLSGPDTE